MKTDFSPKFFRAGDPANALGALGGAFPWGAAAQAGVGLAQTIGGWVQQHKATKALEKLKSPTYSQNQSILDYYNQALSRYNVSPTDSSMFKSAENLRQRNLSSGITALGSRHLATQGIGRLVAGSNDSSLNNEVAAINEQSRRFSQLGGATTMKAGEDRMAFNINETQPFERKYNLLAMKASGGNKVANAGMGNLAGAANTYSQMGMLDKIYGTGKTKKIKTPPIPMLSGGGGGGP